jgi:hypothetical protein
MGVKIFIHPDPQAEVRWGVGVVSLFPKFGCLEGRRQKTEAETYGTCHFFFESEIIQTAADSSVVFGT